MKHNSNPDSTLLSISDLPLSLSSLLSSIFSHITYVCILYPGLYEAFHRRLFHGAGWSTPLLTALPLPAGYSVWQLRRAHYGPLHLCSRSQVSPRALCVRLLSAAAQPRHLQGAEREAILRALLWQTVCVRHLVRDVEIMQKKPVECCNYTVLTVNSIQVFAIFQMSNKRFLSSTSCSTEVPDITSAFWTQLNEECATWNVTEIINRLCKKYVI